MSDNYTQFVNKGLGKALAHKLGLPQPVPLRRYTPEQPLVTGPILVLGLPDSSDTQRVCDQLLALTDTHTDVDVRRHSESDGTSWGAIIVVLSDIHSVGDLSAPLRELGAHVRSLNPSGRIVFITRPHADNTPELSAARNGAHGALRSLAKELRRGATANAIAVADEVDVDALPVTSALRFLLSARSAFVDGQIIDVSSATGTEPARWDSPLAGKVAVVTGAAQGIGAAIARTLARDGATVVAVDVPAAGENLARVANDIEGTALQLDITTLDAGKTILEHAVTRHGGLDIVVHNAGITRDKLLANMDEARWDSVLAVNLESQLRINDALLASDSFTESPRIISLASTSGIAGNRGQTNYGASKAGVIAMVAATAPLLAPRGGTINAVAPGFIETAMTAKIPFATREVARRLNSLQQGGQPIDVAETIAFLASPASGGINGRTLRVCGQNVVGA
ncbi:3-oxoacyl-ACP reductase [Timonella sp. A28]|uniref:3-oxoacyl-ACP reductase n=1 Tax=Timonella sp. A28 TaxID=3442640 RepID=UPI003EBBF0C9